MSINVLRNLASVPTMKVSVKSVDSDGFFNEPQYSGAMGVPFGRDESPEVSWSSFPNATKSFVISMYDPDAPTQSGFWHWAIKDIPATVTGLNEGQGNSQNTVPNGAIVMNNDTLSAGYLGAAPSAGDEAHHYNIVVTALDVEKLDVPENVSPAFLNFAMNGHELARGLLRSKHNFKAFWTYQQLWADSVESVFFAHFLSPGLTAVRYVP